MQWYERPIFVLPHTGFTAEDFASRLILDEGNVAAFVKREDALAYLRHSDYAEKDYLVWRLAPVGLAYLLRTLNEAGLDGLARIGNTTASGWNRRTVFNVADLLKLVELVPV